MTMFRPAILLHGALAIAAFTIALTSAAWRWDVPVPAEAARAAPPAAVYSREEVEHAEAVYRTRRYGEAEDALRCAGFGKIDPTRGSRLLVAGRDYEVVPHPAVRHAADVDLQRLGNEAALCAYLRQPVVHEWYREHFPP